MKLFKKMKKGFTLVELVVVIAIIAILSGVSVAVYAGITNNAKQSAADQEATQLRTLIQVQSVKTWEREKVVGDPTDLVDVSVTWNGIGKCVEVKFSSAVVEENINEYVKKAFDDMIADSQAKTYTWRLNESDHFEFINVSSTDKFVITFDEIEHELDEHLAKIKKMTLKHTNGNSATVFDQNSF